jgi:hypothetical protein
VARPVILNMGDEARRNYEIGALTEYLIGDMDVAALRIPRDWMHAERQSRHGIGGESGGMLSQLALSADSASANWPRSVGRRINAE